MTQAFAQNWQSFKSVGQVQGVCRCDCRSPMAVEPTTRMRILCCIKHDGALKVPERLTSSHQVTCFWIPCIKSMPSTGRNRNLEFDCLCQVSDWQRKASEAESALAASKAQEAVTARELVSMQIKLHEAQGLAEVSKVNSAYNRTPASHKRWDCKEMCL